MNGFEADLAGIGLAATVLTDAADTLGATSDLLTGAGDLGPGRLREVTDTLLADTRAELTALRQTVATDAAHLTQTHRDYTAADEDAGGAFRRTDPW